MTDHHPDDTHPTSADSGKTDERRPDIPTRRELDATQKMPVMNKSTSDTQPIRRPTKPPKKKLVGGFPLRVILPLILGLMLLMLFSGILGWSQGNFMRNKQIQIQQSGYLYEQYVLAKEEAVEGRFDLARQRYEYIFLKDPEFLDVADRWLEIMVIIGGTATPTPQLALINPTPTFDPRPAQELFASAQSLIAVQNWNQAIEVLSSLRTTDPTYNFVQVDQMLYLALRNRGISKINSDGNLEGGLYDFALADGFGPIDAAAANLRVLARLYLIGNSFWVAYPDIAVYYYGQVSAVAPGMRDSTGMTAFYRYWASLVQYADQLAAKEEWCAASEQYQISMNARNDLEILPTQQFVTELCFLLTATVTPTSTATSTSTVTATFGPSQTATPTSTFVVSPTSTFVVTPTSTGGVPPSPSPTITPTTGSSPTPTPTPTPTATSDGG